MIDSLVTPDGASVIDYYLGLITKLAPPETLYDISEFLSDCLIAARKKPYQCFARNSYNTHDRVLTSSIDFSTVKPKDVRPPADWYYPLYFALFIDRMFLLETYENPKGSVSDARHLFRSTSDRLLRATGFRPRVIQIPPLNSDTLDINANILKDGAPALDIIEGRCREVLRAKQTGTSLQKLSITDLASVISREVMYYGMRSS